ncbi:MAG TPA: zinc ribbon domain-containing protein [Bacillota bacterium]|nr:transposase [Peptococcaceae bacterium]HPU35830.1 zinc ribbon domain-containing protein [Bacillota bacterium]HQD75515.1 zinc ribbon domain-containing protein [Bacillota bacterium]
MSVRLWVRPRCGTVHDRDVNAAINRLQYLNSA